MFKDFVAINLCNYRAIVDLASRKVCVCACVRARALKPSVRKQPQTHTTHAKRTMSPFDPAGPWAHPAPPVYAPLPRGIASPILMRLR